MLDALSRNAYTREQSISKSMTRLCGSWMNRFVARIVFIGNIQALDRTIVMYGIGATEQMTFVRLQRGAKDEIYGKK